MGLNGCDGTWRAAVKVAKFVAGWSHHSLYTYISSPRESFKIFTDEIWTLQLIKKIIDWLFWWNMSIHVFDGIRCGSWANNGSSLVWANFLTRIHFRLLCWCGTDCSLPPKETSSPWDCVLQRSFKGQDCSTDAIRFSGSYIHSVVYYFIRSLRDFLFVFFGWNVRRDQYSENKSKSVRSTEETLRKFSINFKLGMDQKC